MLDIIDLDIYENDELKHWGILGMHWGIRRYQNPDGTLTPEGRERYGVKNVSDTKKSSYSERYNYLKNKKNKNEKEQKEFENLEIGKKVFESQLADPMRFNEDFKQLPDNIQQDLSNYMTTYRDSTNYGKGEKFAASMMAISIGAIGFALDAGAIYMQSKASNLPFYFIPSTTFYGALIGAGLGSSLYANKNEQEFIKDYKNSYGNKKFKSSNNILKKYYDEDVKYVKEKYGPLGVVAYDPASGYMARPKGTDYSKTDKDYLEWQKQHSRNFEKKLY